MNEKRELNEKEKTEYKVWTAISVFFLVDIAIGLLIRRHMTSKRPPSSKTNKRTIDWEEFIQQKTHSSHSSSSSYHSQAYRPFESHSHSYHPPKRQIPSLDRHLRNLDMKWDIKELPTQTDVKQAYRTLCLKTHPDVLGADHPNKQQAEKKFIEATSSYNFLLKSLPK